MEAKKSTKLPNRITLSEKPHKDSRWYVVHTQSGYEYKVANTLKQRVESLNLQKEISDILIPTQEKIVIAAGKKRNVQERIFPGYVLIKMNMTDENWLTVRSTDGITGFVGIGTKPSAVSEKEVESVIKFMALETPKYEAKFNVGDGIKMIGGPFQDFIGTVSEVNKGQGKVQVLVSIFGRETPVWVDFEQVSPL